MVGVAFEFDGVLAVDGGLETTAFRRVAQRRRRPAGGAGFDAARAADAAVEVARDAVRHGTRGAMEALAEAFAAVPGLDDIDGALDEYRRTALSLVAGSVSALPGTERTLRQLEALAIPHAILTNGWSALTRAKAQAVGFTGTVLVSDALGVSKPQETAFAALAAVLGLPPDRIWYVGTDPRVDMAAAQKAGFNAVWLCPDEHGAPFPPDLPPPAHIIRRLDELLEILREPYTRSLLGLRYILHNVLEWPPGSFAAGGVEYGLGAEEPAP